MISPISQAQTSTPTRGIKLAAMRPAIDSVLAAPRPVPQTGAKAAGGDGGGGCCAVCGAALMTALAKPWVSSKGQVGPAPCEALGSACWNEASVADPDRWIISRQTESEYLQAHRQQAGACNHYLPAQHDDHEGEPW